MPEITIVMYHYVRDVECSRYPKIKALAVRDFEGQLDYIAAHYNVCSSQTVIAALRGEEILPPDPCVLTFDDGILDHYTTVFPRLDERGFVATFFPIARTVTECKAVDVHKIHFILASTENHRELMDRVFEAIKPCRRETGLSAEDKDLFNRYATPSRFDPPEVVFIKNILQWGLPEDIRSEVVDGLLRQCVGIDERTFCREQYMDFDMLRCMLRHGMEIGGHGYSHLWLGKLSQERQEQEIALTKEFLDAVYQRCVEHWAMSYPSGSYNQVTIKYLRRYGCALALTTRVGLVRDFSKPFELSRLDTNDLPFRRRGGKEPQLRFVARGMEDVR